AIISAFLPAFILSGFIFEISAMPQPIQWLTYLFPVRYLVTCLQTLFLTGNVWPLLGFCVLCMAAIGMIFLTLAVVMSKKRLDA
ncbi:MAG: ABC transporter permease, partial [Alphaproteobacteria bacterium]